MTPTPSDAPPIDAIETPDPPGAATAGDPGSLRVRTARGTIINAFFMVGFQTLGLLKGFVIAAFLTTSEYGVWGILVITLGTLTWLKQIGISDKYVQQDESDQRLAFQKAFTIDLVANIALLALILAALPLFALAYGHWEIFVPGLVLAATIPVQSFKAPAWIYYRDMRYVPQRLIEGVDPVVSFAATVALAVAGFGYWSLVLGYAAGVVAAAAVAMAYSPHPVAIRFDRSTLREYFSFSWPIFVASASGLMIPQISMLLGSRELGLAGAGMITLAGMVGTYTDKIDELVTWTLYPAICRIKDQTELLFEAFIKSNRLALMWGVPFGVMVTLFASDLVQFGIGEQWRPAVGLLQVFGLIAAAHHVGFNWTAFFSARGQTRPMAIAGPIILTSFVIFVVPLTLAFELDGFAAGMAAMTVVSLLVRTWFLTRLFPGFRMLGHMARAVAPTVPAVATTLALRAAVGGPRTLGIAIGELAVYFAVTVVFTFVFERALIREVVSYVRARAQPLAEAPA